MKRIIKAPIAGVAAVALMALGAPAHAATDDRFPDIAGAPSWYTTAPEAPYAMDDTTTGDQHSAQNETQWFANAWWYGPEGGAPDKDDSDITIENSARESWDVGATDPEVITLSINDAFPELAESLGTELSTGVVIPSRESAVPTVRFPGAGVVVVQRPARDCLVRNDIKDPDEFWINVAMLGENQHKYLVALNLEFGLRTWKDACTGTAAPAAPDEPKSTEPPNGAEPPATTSREKPTQDDATAENAGVAPSDDTGPIIGMLVGTGVAVLALLSLLFRRSRTHANDGTPLKKAGALDHEGRPAKPSEFGR